VLALSIQIERFVNDHQPGFVECRLVDVFGRSHLFVEKVPVVTTAHLGPGSTYPCAGQIACEVESASNDAQGRKLLQVNTGRPWGVESTGGVSSFWVLSAQVASL
jgi:hypothetical protein